MKKPAGILALILFCICTINAQHQNVIVGNSIVGPLPTEASIVINPADSDEIMIGAMSNNYYISNDGGYAWTHGVVQSPWGVQADPVVLVDNTGRFYYIHLPDVIERVVCHRRDDISSGWSQESFAAYNGTHETDKEWAAYDPVNDKIYLSWTYFDDWGSANPNDSSCIYLSWSADAGESWADPVRISDEKGNAQGGSYSMHGSYPVTGPDGEVYICWWGPDGLMFDRSLDQGQTWLAEDINITNHVNWIYTIPGVELGVSFPVIACDRSGGDSHGNIYICWADKRNGSGDADVFMVVSQNGGLAWSDPIRVNDDPPGRHQFFPFVTVDQVTGKVWVVFYDRRNYSDTNTDVFMAVSEDGGESYVNFKVSESSFVPYSTVFFGHYIALAAVDDKVIPVWNRMDTGVSTLMCAIVDPDMVGSEELSLEADVEMTSSPNPFQESLFISFKISSPTTVTLKLFDLSGRLINTIIDNQEYSYGKYVEKIQSDQLDLKPGLYHIKLIAGSSMVVNKVLCVAQ